MACAKASRGALLCTTTLPLARSMLRLGLCVHFGDGVLHCPLAVATSHTAHLKYVFHTNSFNLS